MSASFEEASNCQTLIYLKKLIKICFLFGIVFTLFSDWGGYARQKENLRRPE